MQLVVLTDNALKEELLSTGIQEGTEITWISSEEEFRHHNNADAFIDLLFFPETSRIEILKSILPKPVFINDPLNKKPADTAFIRFNGWPTMLKRNILEASCANESEKSKAQEVIHALNRTAEWTPDIPGFITLRVLAMIINEAYFAFGDGVSTKKEIDIAMKLGTNYPYGPFEWSKKIGLKNIYELLVELRKSGNRYEPAPALLKEVI